MSTIRTQLWEDVGIFRKIGAVPRVHGNGFLQLDLEPGRRLHVWGHSDLPRQTQDTGIHNHRFDFHSRCVAGRVFNIVYSVRRTDSRGTATHMAHSPRVREGEDTALEPSHLVYVYHNPSVRLVVEGDGYTMLGPVFHETVSDRPSATIMTKTTSLHPAPLVLVPLGREPDNEFNRNSVMDPAQLWEIIHEVLS